MTRYMAAAAILMLAACGGGEDKAPPSPQDDAAPAATAPPAAAAPAADPDAMARWEEDRGYEPDPSEPPLTGTEPGIGSGAKAIPAAIRGRWALDASDCPKRPGTDLTALVIDAANLRFHESHGELARIREIDPRRIVADYKFSGEGIEWNRLMLFDLADGGKTLIRRDYGEAGAGEGAAAGPMRYTRCA
ncbi:hypothetical protein [Sphingopyxis sp.]|uniref:hypothetical protein n=1 Tax=Sphingopyxis sp. TaxID=1908224 RepID=UPI003F6EDAA1